MIRFSIILPSVQVPFAVGLWEWGVYQTHAKSLGSLPWTIAPMVCQGINAPAILPARLVSYPFRMTDLRHFLPHFSLEEWIFFIGVAVIWFLVGLAIDRRKTKRASSKLSLRSGFCYLLLVIEAIFLFAQALPAFDLHWHPGDYYYWAKISESVLFLAWSFALIGIPISTFVRRRQS